VVRLGYVPGLTQATALTAIQDRLFSRELGNQVTLRVVAFPTDQAEAAALAAGKLDAAYASPDVILTAASTTPGRLRIIAGAATGGAELVVRPQITSPEQLTGQVLAAPAGTGPQAAALRSWLTARHLAGPSKGQSPVTVRPLTPAAAVAAFLAGRIAGAWALPPADVQMADAGGRVLFAQSSAGITDQPLAVGLVVRTDFLSHHTAAVIAMLRAHAMATELLHGSLLQVIPGLSRILRASGIQLPSPVLAASLAQITFTDSPGVASLLPGTASTGFSALYDLAPLDLVLRTLGQRPVTP
jgi:NitT/TauT family transport system substrate-binding protein